MSTKGDVKGKGLPGFLELYEYDLSEYVKKKPTFKKVNGRSVKLPEDRWLDYVEWSMILVLLYRLGAKVVRYGVEEVDWYPARFNQSGKNPFVKVCVKVDEREEWLYYPVISGSTAKEDPDQGKIHIAAQRGFVKCVAINWGLGLKLWHREEEDMSELEGEKELREKEKLDNELIEKFSELAKLKGGAKEAYQSIGRGQKDMKALVKTKDLESKKVVIEELNIEINKFKGDD